MRALKRPLLEPQQTCSPCAKAALASCARQKVFILKFGLRQNEGHGRPSKPLYQLSIFKNLHPDARPWENVASADLSHLQEHPASFQENLTSRMHPDIISRGQGAFEKAQESRPAW